MSFRRVLAARAASWLLVLSSPLVGSAVAHGQPAAPGPVTPPVALSHPNPPYPQSEMDHPREVTVILSITIEKDGTVSHAEVHQSAGAAFDEAALAAVRTWTFTPAQRGGKPLKVRQSAMFHFDPPAVEAATSEKPPPAPTHTGPKTEARTEAKPEPAPTPPEAPAPEADAQPKALDVDVKGHKDRSTGAAGEYVVPLDKLAYVPAKNASGRLGLAPGILLSNEGGEGHAEQVFIRGFDTHEG